MRPLTYFQTIVFYRIWTTWWSSRICCLYASILTRIKLNYRRKKNQFMKKKRRFKMISSALILNTCWDASTESLSKTTWESTSCNLNWTMPSALSAWTGLEKTTKSGALLAPPCMFIMRSAWKSSRKWKRALASALYAEPKSKSFDILKSILKNNSIYSCINSFF